MFAHKHNPLDPVGGTETPEPVALHRRRWLKGAGLTVGCGMIGWGGIGGWRYLHPPDKDVLASGQTFEPATAEREQIRANHDERFRFERPETDRAEAARYTNFYEFSRFKDVWRNVNRFRPRPWTLTVAGLCRNKLRFDIDELQQRFAAELVERQYRHRCVETWAMAVPWIGIPLARLLQAADPLAGATHVRFISFHRPDEAPRQASNPTDPWPYEEGLTLPEARNELALLVTGMYGQPLLKQHGAPLRLVVPWKYGFKSIKSIERIELVDYQPETFWSTLNPSAYPFESNVEPGVPRPWPQESEWMLGTKTRYPTQLYNGYGEWVAPLYER